MFASPNIWKYSAHALLVNAYFAELNSFMVHVHYEDKGSFYHAEDVKWNKIGMTFDALSPKHGWASHMDYILIIDADVILLHPNIMNVTKIVSIYPEAHLILSGDTLDVANAGVIIVKNSKWSYNFFELWWELRHTIPCDQHAFNDLYYRTLNTKVSKRRIKILAADEINTPFPAAQTFDEKNAGILHLQGYEDEVRSAVFGQASTFLCQRCGRNTSHSDYDTVTGRSASVPGVADTVSDVQPPLPHHPGGELACSSVWDERLSLTRQGLRGVDEQRKGSLLSLQRAVISDLSRRLVALIDKNEVQLDLSELIAAISRLNSLRTSVCLHPGNRYVVGEGRGKTT